MPPQTLNDPLHDSSPAASGTAVPDGYSRHPDHPRPHAFEDLRWSAKPTTPWPGAWSCCATPPTPGCSSGAIVDAGGQVHEWVELWVQSPDGIADTLASWREVLSNAALDERWRCWARALVVGRPAG